MNPQYDTAHSAPDPAEGYDQAIGLLCRCATRHGFVASPGGSHNYGRIWARDGAILSLAALLTGAHELITTVRRTLVTLAEYQGPHGEIPSNVDPEAGRISYGGTAGRVDADLWFIIACGEYWQASGDEAFLDRVLPVIEKTRALLGAWEFNNRGLLYVPLTGDWADEYLHNGYVLYDQLLYLQVQRTLARLHSVTHGSSDHPLHERISRLRHLIRANYWFDGNTDTDDVYHETLHEKGLRAATHNAGRHWMASFSPSGYAYRFDTLANVLASLLEVADTSQTDKVDDFIASHLVRDELPMRQAFHPVIQPVDEDWEDLQVMFSYSFKNRPYEFQNGGLWAMITGFYVADLARRQQTDRARIYLQAIHRANALPMDDRAWGFAEYLHGQTLQPGGTREQGWSAAAAVIAHHALQGQPLLRIGGREP